MCPGLFVLGEANFSVHGANRLGASALMQGLADGYFVIPYTVATTWPPSRGRSKETILSSRTPIEDVDERIKSSCPINGKGRPPNSSRAGQVTWDNCGMARSEASLTEALAEIPAIREEFWKNVKVLGESDELNQSLENAGRVADFLEFGELMCRDALHRDESLRRPLPRGTPDRRRRGQAQR